MDIGLERILQEVVGLRKDHRELLVSFRRLRPVHDWWLKQHEEPNAPDAKPREEAWS